MHTKQPTTTSGQPLPDCLQPLPAAAAPAPAEPRAHHLVEFWGFPYVPENRKVLDFADAGAAQEAYRRAANNSILQKFGRVDLRTDTPPACALPCASAEDATYFLELAAAMFPPVPEPWCVTGANTRVYLTSSTPWTVLCVRLERKAADYRIPDADAHHKALAGLGYKCERIKQIIHPGDLITDLDDGAPFLREAYAKAEVSLYLRRDDSRPQQPAAAPQQGGARPAPPADREPGEVRRHRGRRGGRKHRAKREAREQDLGRDRAREWDRDRERDRARDNGRGRYYNP